MAEALIRDVTLRDGLQLVRATMPTPAKLALARFLLAQGVPEIEIGAVVRPDRVPALADTLDLVAALDADSLDRSWVLVPNPTGVRRAIDAGVRRLQYVLSVSASHNRANVGCDVQRSLDGLATSIQLARTEGVTIQLALATAFTCPFEGRTPEEAVLAIVTDPRVEGVASIALCDTIGQAVPEHVTGLTRSVREHMGAGRLVFHGHDTWGLGVANSVAAVAAGADTVDAALGGLGGCPFAPGASGNTALEDVLYALRPSWLTPEVYHRILQRGRALVSELGEPDRSRAAEGASRSSGSHPWALSAAEPAA